MLGACRAACSGTWLGRPGRVRRASSASICCCLKWLRQDIHQSPRRDSAPGRPPTHSPSMQQWECQVRFRSRPAPRTEAAHRFEPIHLRHLTVHEDDVKGMRAKRIQCFAPIVGEADFTPEIAQHRARDFLIDHIVFSYQHLGAMSAATASVRLATGCARATATSQALPAAHAGAPAWSGIDRRRFHMRAVLRYRLQAKSASPFSPGQMRVAAQRRRHRQAVHDRHLHVDDGNIEWRV